MKRLIFQNLSFFLILFLFSCNSENKHETENKNSDSTQFVNAQYKLPGTITPEELSNIDLKQDISNRSLQELRILRNAVYAKYGYLFMSADLRGFFNLTDWYATKMEERWWAEEEGKAIPEIVLTADEQAFVDRIKVREEELLKQNYVQTNGLEMANLSNVVNLFQYQELKEPLLQKLANNGFVIVEASHIQHFHLYEQNDYSQTPNFVTTDMYLQLFHMYFGYVLKTLEQEKFIPILTKLTETLYNESAKIANTTTNAEVKELSQFSQTYYAIANYILTGKKLEVPANFKTSYNEEVQNINAQTDNFSEFLQFKEAYFPYSLMKPRGHYTRTEELKKYFSAMMWLQTAPFCRETNDQLKKAIFHAYLLNSAKTTSGESVRTLYNSIYEPVVFLIGEPDNLSIMDICDFLKTKNLVTSPADVIKSNVVSAVSTELQRVATTRNRIKPKQEISCRDKINFMPQRYIADNEVIQELVDAESEVSKRPFPKGLDVFAAFGIESAEDLLLNFHKEGEVWSDYVALLNSLKEKFKDKNSLLPTVYNKWISSLFTLCKKQTDYPYFMQTQMWERKNLNTALASWAELKHDAILYAEQPFAAECGGGGPPAPITVGYVEPNVAFWKEALELTLFTEKMLADNALMTEDMQAKTDKMKEVVEFLLSASEKEIAGKDLTDQEYQTIEIIGSTFEYLTLQIVEPDKYLDSWDNVQGPDKSVAVIADIYTNNADNTEQNGVLHVATGNVNEIFVIVEIKGNLYLTKGAVFSYYEFTQPLGTRLTDEEWQKMIEEKKLPEIPKWMLDIIIPSDNAPITDERFFYSSGC